MVDEKKVRTMIELARYEEGEGKEDLRIRRFYRGDYLTVQLIKNWFLTTISYISVIYCSWPFWWAEIWNS